MKFLCVLICILLCGCAKTEKIDIFAMDTVISLEVYGESTSDALEEMENEIRRIDKKFSPEKEYDLDEEMEYIIKTAKQIGELTDGSFDIELGAVMSEWGFRDGSFRVPDYNTIVSARDRKEYDFGGIAKGYAGNRLSQIAEKYSLSGILSLGGNVQALGKKQDGTLWKVGITNPKNPSDYLGYVEVADKAVVTSGAYQRFFEENGKIYHHIINPKTGYPADSGLLSVTVISESGIIADALSTAFFVAGKETAIELYNGGKIEFEAVFVSEDGEIFETENAGFVRKE